MIETESELNNHIARYGTEDKCPQNPQGDWHEPNWLSISVEVDGDGLYVDVSCRWCGRSGCLGSVNKLEEDLNW